MPDGDKRRGSRGPQDRVHARRRGVVGRPSARSSGSSTSSSTSCGITTRRPAATPAPPRPTRSAGRSRRKTACCCAGSRKGCTPSIPSTRAFARLIGRAGRTGEQPQSTMPAPTPWGRVWFGTMDDGEKADTGRFYVFDRGQVTPAGPDRRRDHQRPGGEPGRRADLVHRYARQEDPRRRLARRRGRRRARLFVDTAAHFPDAYPDGPVCRCRGLPVDRALCRRPDRPLRARRQARCRPCRCRPRT